MIDSAAIVVRMDSTGVELVRPFTLQQPETTFAAVSVTGAALRARLRVLDGMCWAIMRRNQSLVVFGPRQ